MLPPRRFVHAARFHSDEAVFDQIKPADAVLTSVIVELFQQRSGRHGLAIYGNSVAALEIDRDVLREYQAASSGLLVRE